MAEVVESIDISRRPGDVFAYAADFSHFPEWQGGVVSARRDGDGPLAVGSRAIVTRRAHGIARLLLPLVVRRQARKQLPRNQQRLKEVLERGA